MELIFEQLKCPRDRLSFRSQCDRVPMQTEICLDTEDPNGYLALMRQRYWTSVIAFGVPLDVAYWGCRLEKLEIRTMESVSLNFVEFLPKLKRLRVSCGCVSTGIGWKTPTVECVEVVTSTSVYIHPEMGKMPNLTRLAIEAGEIRGDPRTQLPPSLKTIRLTGTTRDEILGIIASSRVETLALRRALLCELPPIPTNVVSLDLSGNFITSWDRFENAPTLRRLILDGNIGFFVPSLRDLHLEYLDLRGTGETYPSMPRLKELVHSHDPPSNVGTLCPEMEHIHIKPTERVPIPGSCVPTLATHGYWYPGHGHVAKEQTPPPSPRTRWTSYIDDIRILYER